MIGLRYVRYTQGLQSEFRCAEWCGIVFDFDGMERN